MSCCCLVFLVVVVSGGCDGGGGDIVVVLAPLVLVDKRMKGVNVLTPHLLSTGNCRQGLD